MRMRVVFGSGKRARRVGAGIILGATALAVGCFEITEQIAIKPDLSGSATLRMVVDFEPMVYVMAAMQENAALKSGDKPKTPAKKTLAKLKADFSKKNQAELKKKEKETLAKLSANLPEGVSIKRLKLSGKGLKVTHELVLAFDHVANLRDVDFSTAEEAGSPVKNPLAKPFAGLEVLEEEETVSLGASPVTPSLGASERPEAETGSTPAGGGAATGAAPVGPATGALPATGSTTPATAPTPKQESLFAEMPEVARMIAKTKVVFELTLPGRVIEHNATKQRGNKLTWVFDAKKLEERAKQGEAAEGIHVKFSKSK